MKFLICYFSGTGNTKKVVEKYKETFETNGHEATLVALPAKNVADIKFGSFDAVGFAYPIHGFNAPAVLLNFVQEIQKLSETQKAFIFKTSGEPILLNSASSLKLQKLLRQKNFSIENEFRYIMPYNMIFRHTEHRAHVMWETAQKLIPLDVAKILRGEKTRERRFFMDAAFAWVLRIEHFGAWFNGLFFHVDKNCIHCGKCVRNCPVSNITEKNGRFHFGAKCTMCMRCSFHCPTNAIHIGMFNGWKVNGAYKFAEPAEQEIDAHARYCKKAYDEYFAEAERRITETL